jgi:hypothetical protein
MKFFSHKKWLLLVGAGLLVVGMASATAVFAQDTSVGMDIGTQLQAAGGSQGAGLGNPTDPRVTAMLLIRSLLRLISIIVFCYMLYAGFRWMTAGGNDEQITEAKKIIRNCVIGLAVILSSYSITYFAVTLALGAPSSPGLNALLF